MQAAEIELLNKISIGVAGAGVFGAHHIAKIDAHENTVFSGVCDLNNARAKELTEKFGGIVFEDFEALVAEVDAVVIAAPASKHFELAQMSLSAGKHTFVEKPLALSLENADRLIELASSKSLVLQVGHQERYVFAAAGLFARDNAPQRIECTRSTNAVGRCEDVSVVFDLMIHDLDLVRKLTKGELLGVTAEGGQDSVSTELTLSNGSTAVMSATRKAASVERRMILTYDDGIIDFDFVKRTCTNTTPQALKADVNEAANNLALSDPLAFGADQFVSAILSGADPIISGEDGRAAVDWALQIEEALPISLDNKRDTEERLYA